MKTLKVKKRIEKFWRDLSPVNGFWTKMEKRDYIVQMTEEEYFEYIRWKGEAKITCQK